MCIGLFGLAMAKTYIEVNPSDQVVVLESAETLGGVWAEHRLYPGLMTNNLVGTYEFSDFPLDKALYNVKPDNHIPGDVVHKYLHAYAEKFDVYRRIRFRSIVSTAEKQDHGGWLVTFTDGANTDGHLQIRTKKLIIATGLTSEPFLPELKGMESFEGPLFHSKYFHKHAETLKTTTNVMVYGGSKSAWDVAYAYASAGVKVNWVIRSSGHGPVWMMPPHVTPFKVWMEKLVHTRFLTWFSPCIWADTDGYSSFRRFFHRTTMGRWLVNAFWKTLANDAIQTNRYHAHPETKKLKPWADPLFIGATPSGALNYPTNFFDFVRNGQIKVHIADITEITTHKVHLSSNIALEPDVIVCCTGWKHRPPITFLPAGIEVSLGLPHFSSQQNELRSQADVEICNRFPKLKTSPIPQNDVSPRGNTNQPYRLYRFMVPPSQMSEHSIGFAGALKSISAPLIAQTQALWLTAYLGGKLDIKGSEDEIIWQTMLHSQFGKWRSPYGFGGTYPDFFFDALPYLDSLLQDLHLKSHRKKGMFSELFVPYGQEDYKGLIDEWKAQQNI